MERDIAALTPYVIIVMPEIVLKMLHRKCWVTYSSFMSNCDGMGYVTVQRTAMSLSALLVDRAIRCVCIMTMSRTR